MPIDTRNEKMALIDWGRCWHPGVPYISDGMSLDDQWALIYETITPLFDIAPITVLLAFAANINGVSGSDTALTANINQTEPVTTNIRQSALTFTASY